MLDVGSTAATRVITQVRGEGRGGEGQRQGAGGRAEVGWQQGGVVGEVQNIDRLTHPLTSCPLTRTLTSCPLTTC